MHINVAWSGRRGKCSLHCSEPILKYTKVVRGTGLSSAGYRYRLQWHFDCWVKQALEYLDEHKPEPRAGGPGRKELGLDADTRRQRHNLIVMAYRLKLRRTAAIESSQLWKLDELDKKLEGVKAELELVGGKPSHWV